MKIDIHNTSVVRRIYLLSAIISLIFLIISGFLLVFHYDIISAVFLVLGILIYANAMYWLGFLRGLRDGQVIRRTSHKHK